MLLVFTGMLEKDFRKTIDDIYYVLYPHFYFQGDFILIKFLEWCMLRPVIHIPPPLPRALPNGQRLPENSMES